MSQVEVAVLTYHGWEIDPQRLADDVATLRLRGWRDLSLDDLRAVLTERGPARPGRYFHVTFDDGAEGDRACVDALQALACPVTLFVSLDTMNTAARGVYRDLIARPDVRVEDHSLRHERAFHYRGVMGFHSDERPFMSSPEQMGLQPGDPVCVYGGELSARSFVPEPRARELCREVARASAERPGTPEWTAGLSERLVAAGLGSRRFGRLCVAGTYESYQAFSERVSVYLAEGRSRLAAVLGRGPVAFAHPWWEPSPTADARLRQLGYTMTFAGRGLCRRPGAFAIPRLFVSNSTVRPIDPDALAASPPSAGVRRWVRHLGRRAIYA